MDTIENSTHINDTDFLDLYPELTSKIVVFADESTWEQLKDRVKEITENLKNIAKWKKLEDVCYMTEPFEEFRRMFPWMCTGHELYHPGQIYPAQINSTMYLSSSYCGSDLDILKRLDIKMVLNCTSECKNHFPNEIEYENVNVQDDSRENISDHFAKCFEFIDKAEQSKTHVLVHCSRGVSRSATIVIAYLMQKNKWTMKEAFEHVKRCRSIISPNEGFLEQLNKFQKMS